MIQVKIGKVSGIVSGSTYTITAEAEAWDYARDNDGWRVASTTLTAVGSTTDTATTVKTNVLSVADAWKTSLKAATTFATKVANLEGTVL